MAKTETINGREFAIGETVKVHTRFGTKAEGKITGFGSANGNITAKIALPDKHKSVDERWEYEKGKFWDRFKDIGIFPDEFSRQRLGINPNRKKAAKPVAKKTVAKKSKKAAIKPPKSKAPVVAAAKSDADQQSSSTS